MARFKKMNLRNLRQRFFKRIKLTINPWPGGELSLWRKRGKIVCSRSYQTGEETESDLEFGHCYFMEEKAYMKGLKDLEEMGSCSIPISHTRVWHDCRLNPVPDTVDMELQHDETIEILGIKTPWTVRQISEDLNKTISPLEIWNPVRDDTRG